MSLAASLVSFESQAIKEELFSILHEVVPLEILELHQAYLVAPDKHVFFAQFETSPDKPWSKPPQLLEQLTHYWWIRLELIYLTHQKASLNRIKALKKEVTTGDTSTSSNPAKPSSAATTSMTPQEDSPRAWLSPLESIDQAIREDRAQGVTIQVSIDKIHRMLLQIIGTEHPTDPLSQKARDTLTQTANAMDAAEPDQEKIKQLVSDLWVTDAVPPARRSVVEEVNRNIDIALEPLYDNVPAFVDEILTAYKRHYGEAEYLAYENEILAAIGALLRDASWPGFDADGNDNITAEAMRNALRLYRIRIAEKHSHTLDVTVGKSAKRIERGLRETLLTLGQQLIWELHRSEDPKAQEIFLSILTKQTTASKFLSDRRFPELILLYQAVKNELASCALIMTSLCEVVETQLSHAQTLVHLTQFSGLYREDQTEHTGSIQRLKKTFAEYKQAIRDNTDAIDIKNSAGVMVPAGQFVLAEYSTIVQTHQALLDQHPQLKRQLQCFGIQLRSFGMTYGLGHIRQDSSVFTKVWNALLSDLILLFPEHPLLLPLRGRSYRCLEEAERMALHKQLQDGSESSKTILAAIYHRHKNAEYLSGVQYQSQPDFYWVRSELDRLELAARHHDMFENIIISNSEHASHILEVESLLALFSREFQRSPLTIVPLLEKRLDLENYENILLDYIKTRIQQELENIFDGVALEERAALQTILNIKSRADIKHFVESKNRQEFRDYVQAHPMLRPYLQTITIEIMIGFSDTERVSGVSALISIQEAQENFIALAQDFGVTPKFYHGPGGDLNRGGLKRRDQKATLQGNARSNVLTTPASTQEFRENQFYQSHHKVSNPQELMEVAMLPEEMKPWLATCTQYGTAFYEHLHDTTNGLGQLLGLLLGQDVHWMVSILNSSSRATQRGVAENTGDRTSAVQTYGLRPEPYIHPDKPRAITATQMKEMLRDYLNFVGPGAGLREIGHEKALWLYDSCLTFRDMIEKLCMAGSMRDLSFLGYALFGDRKDLFAHNDEQRDAWAQECQQDYPPLLKTLNIGKMSQDPKNREQLLLMLSRLFAYIEVECQKTQTFLFSMLNRMGGLTHLPVGERKKPHNPRDLLARYPLWRAETEEIATEEEPLCYLMARQAHLVAKGAHLDQVYAGLNTEEPPTGCLTLTGRLITNVGAAINAARITQPSFYELSSVNYRDNSTRLKSFERAQEAGAKMERHHTPATPFLTAAQKENLEVTLASQLSPISVDV